MKLVVSVVAMMLLISPVFASEWQESPEIKQIFERAGVNGTFVLFDAEKGVLMGHNKKRAETRFVPASTFKIPNTLIGLSTGAVESVDDILPYGGGKCLFDVWEKDMGLRDAIVISNVPIYQELARRVGLQDMQANVEKLHYGNRQIGEQVDSFWLEGPLKISAIEQVQFLNKLAHRQLPFSERNQSAVHEITLFEENEEWEIHAKTGLSLSGYPGIGWWVGWVKKGDNVYAFAFNMEINESTDKNKRIPTATAALEALGVI